MEQEQQQQQAIPSSVLIMERTGKIIRKSIHTLLKDFHFFTTIPVFLLLPFSASVLLSQSVYQSFSSLILPFPDQLLVPSRTVSLHGLNLCQMVFSYLFTLPFALSFLVLAKASVVRSLNGQKPSLSLYGLLVSTYLCNMVVIIAVTFLAFFLIRTVSNFFEQELGLSTRNPLFLLGSEVVFYLIFTNTMVICNLALVVAGMDGCSSGLTAINKACLLRKGTKSMPFLLALPINFGLAAVDSLFRYRIVSGYGHGHGHGDLFGSWPNFASVVLEGTLIAYLFSLLIVLDTITSCLFVESCESNVVVDEEQSEISYVVIIEIGDGEVRISTSSQRLEEFNSLN